MPEDLYCDGQRGKVEIQEILEFSSPLPCALN